MPAPTVNLRTLAAAAGTSISTVSRALRGSSEIGEPRRRQIQALARNMGYEPNPMGAGLAHYKKTSTVKPVQAALAWLNAWPNPAQLYSYPLFEGYWRGASAAAAKFGYRLEEFQINAKTPLRKIEKILYARGIQGILLPPHGGTRMERRWRELDWSKFSVVRFGFTIPLSFHTVMTDVVENAMLAFHKIREKGYRRVGFVSTEESEYYTPGAGFLWAQATCHYAQPLPPFLLDRNRKPSQKSFEAWLNQHRPDVLITDSNEIPGLLKMAGLRIPDDIAYVGMCVPDCYDSAGVNHIPEEIGRAAALALISLVNEHDRGEPRHGRRILIPGVWVEGATLPLCRSRKS